MAVEVKTKLTLDDDEVTSGLKNVEGKVDSVADAEKKASAGFKDWAQTGAHVAQALGVSLSDVLGKVKEFGTSILDAGSKAETGDHALAALISTVQGKEWDGAIEQAEQLGDRFDELGVKAGISGDEIGAAFQRELEIVGATEDGVRKASVQIEQMAMIAGHLDKNVEGIAQEFGFMQEGALKMKGQLFQLLQPTGIFGKNAKEAGEHWAKLTEGKRAELLAYGLEKVSDKLGPMPLTFKQVQAGLENMVRLSKEDLGQPLLDELSPALDELSKELEELGPDIREFSRAMAKDVGAAVREGGKQLKDAVGWLKDHKDEIAAGFREGAAKIKEVVQFILDHKAEIAGAFAVKTAAPLVAGPGKAAASVAAGVYQAGSAGGGGGVLGVASAGAAGGAVALAAFAAAVAAVGAAAYQGAKLLTEYKDVQDTQLGGMRRLMALADKGDVEGATNAARTMRQIDEGLGRLDPKLKEFYDSIERTAKAKALQNQDEEDMLRRQIELGKRGAQNADAMAGGGGKDTQAATAQYASNQVAVLVNAYNEATKQGNTAMATFAAQTLVSSNLVGKAFLESTASVEGGFSAMADLLLTGGSQFADAAKKLKDKGAGATPKGPVINFNGGQTFQIKQDFRQADPDRVAIAFRKDVARMAGRSLQSRFSGAFGG